jgi:hypothetical protein
VAGVYFATFLLIFNPFLQHLAFMQAFNTSSSSSLPHGSVVQTVQIALRSINSSINAVTETMKNKPT